MQEYFRENDQYLKIYNDATSKFTSIKTFAPHNGIIGNASPFIQTDSHLFIITLNDSVAFFHLIDGATVTPYDSFKVDHLAAVVNNNKIYLYFAYEIRHNVDAIETRIYDPKTKTSVTTIKNSHRGGSIYIRPNWFVNGHQLYSKQLIKMVHITYFLLESI